jgi:hypothetical protein
MRRAFLPAFAITGLLVHGACGGGGSGGADISTGGGVCGTYRWAAGSEACAACMDASCCAEEQHCGDGTSCGRLLTCFAGCDATDDGCRGNCEAINSVGAAALAALFSCHKTQCGTVTTCGAGVCDSRIAVGDATCAECLGTSCCLAFETCGQDSTCVSCLLSWSSECEGYQAFDDALGCMDNKCADTCGLAICDSKLGYTGLPSCNTCMSERCCAEVKACAQNTACHACALGGTDLGCADDPLLTAWNSCAESSCADVCGL